MRTTRSAGEACATRWLSCGGAVRSLSPNKRWKTENGESESFADSCADAEFAADNVAAENANAKDVLANNLVMTVDWANCFRIPIKPEYHQSLAYGHVTAQNLATA